MDDKSPAGDASTNSDLESIRSSNYEQGREELRISNPQGLTMTRTGVDVEKAEYEFSELNRKFSSISHQARRLSKQASRASKPTATGEDVEKAGSSADSDEPWDLETTLRGNRAAEEEAGIKDKHIGIFRLLCYVCVLANTRNRRHLGQPHCSRHWRREDLH